MYHMRFWIIFLCILIAANTLIYREILTPKSLEMAVFEVGKSSAILVRTPSGKTILIDTGADASILRALGTALPEWQRSINAIILTSDKAAQTGGLQSITNRYHVAHILRFGSSDLPYGTKITLDADATIEVLAPERVKIDQLPRLR